MCLLHGYKVYHADLAESKNGSAFFGFHDRDIQKSSHPTRVGPNKRSCRRNYAKTYKQTRTSRMSVKLSSYPTPYQSDWILWSTKALWSSKDPLRFQLLPKGQERRRNVAVTKTFVKITSRTVPCTWIRLTLGVSEWRIVVTMLQKLLVRSFFSRFSSHHFCSCLIFFFYHIIQITILRFLAIMGKFYRTHNFMQPPVVCGRLRHLPWNVLNTMYFLL